jgi:hypothetical protein
VKRSCTEGTYQNGIQLTTRSTKQHTALLAAEHLGRADARCADCVADDDERAYRELDEFTETRRGIGLTVKEGVRELLLKRERRKFLAEEWPGIRERIESVEIDADELLER